MKTALIFCALAALAGCDQGPSQPGSAGSAAPSAPTPSAAAAPAHGGTNKTLALADPGGTSAVDTEIKTRQKKLQTLGEGAPTDEWILLGRAWIRKARESTDPGFYLHAKACADLVSEVSPGNVLALNLEAQVKLNDHKFDDARSIAEQILSQRPDDIDALGSQSDAMLELGRYDEAIKASEKMVDLKPFLPSYIRASYLSWLKGDTKQALESARLAIESGKDPTEPEPRCWAMVQAALIFWHQGDYAGADAGFLKALGEFPDYPPALVGRGRVAMAKGDPKQAAELFATAHKASPLVDTAWRLGDARAAAGDTKGAEEAWAQAIKDGRKTDHRTLAFFFSIKNRDTQEAVKLAEEEMKVRPGVYTEDAYAWALYRAGKLAEAKAHSEKATRLGTKDAQLLYHAGAIKIAAGDKAGGEELVKKALAMNPKFDPTGAPEAEKLVGASDK